jgi:hypothetical protein
MIIIGNFLLLLNLLILGIDAKGQTIKAGQLAPLVGVKVPNEIIQISSWITEDKGLIVELHPNNEM